MLERTLGVLLAAAAVHDAQQAVEPVVIGEKFAIRSAIPSRSTTGGLAVRNAGLIVKYHDK